MYVLYNFNQVKFLFYDRENYKEDYIFECGGKSIVDKATENISEEIKREWYTICGKSHSDYQSFVGIIAALAAIAIPTYSYLFIL